MRGLVSFLREMIHGVLSAMCMGELFAVMVILALLLGIRHGGVGATAVILIYTALFVCLCGADWCLSCWSSDQ
jgi:hypothetical protein